MKVFLIALFSLFNNYRAESDFVRLINSTDAKVYYLTSPSNLAEHLKMLPVKECPETIFFIFSNSGKQLSATAYSKNDLIKYLSNKPLLRRNSVLCVFINGALLV